MDEALDIKEEVGKKFAVSFKLPWPPSVNHYYGQRKGGGKYIKKDGVAFRKEARKATAHVREECQKHITKDTRLIFTMHIFSPDRRRRDIDNLSKAVFDALSYTKPKDKDKRADIYPDDTQIDGMVFSRSLEDIVKGGAIVVTITEI